MIISLLIDNIEKLSYQTITVRSSTEHFFIFTYLFLVS